MRVILALMLSDELKEELGRVERQIQKSLPYGISFTRLDQLHLTLRFIPEIKEIQIPLLIKGMQTLCKEMAPFTLTLQGCTGFPSHGPLRVVWSTVAEQSAEPVIRAHKLCEQMVRSHGFEIEAKPYVPHITLGRVKRNLVHDDVRKTLSHLKVYEVSQTVNAMTLFQSDLTVRGSVHLPLHIEQFSSASTAKVCMA